MDWALDEAIAAYAGWPSLDIWHCEICHGTFHPARGCCSRHMRKVCNRCRQEYGVWFGQAVDNCGIPWDRFERRGCCVPFDQLVADLRAMELELR